MRLGGTKVWSIVAAVTLTGVGAVQTLSGAGVDEAASAATSEPTAETNGIERSDDLDLARTPTTPKPVPSTTSTTVAPTTTTTEAPTTTTTAPPPPPTTAPPTTTPPAPPTTQAPPPPPPTTAPPTTQAPPPPSGPQHGTRNTGCEQYMFAQINQARANAGRQPLAWDSGIQYIAIDWSDHLAGTQKLAHNPNYGSQIAKHRSYSTAGENVGRGWSNASLFQAFMDSPGHRANIESAAFTHGTVGCINDGSGQLWVTQNFWG